MSVDISPLYERRQAGEGDACDRKSRSLLHLARARKTSQLLIRAEQFLRSEFRQSALIHASMFVGVGMDQGSDLELKIDSFVSFPGTAPNL